MDKDNGMVDDFLTVASGFDWITPTVAFIQDFFNGPVTDFGISPYTGWGRGDIKNLLNSHGVRVWGLTLNLSGDLLMFTVPKAQAKRAYYLLQREGAPVLYAPAEIASSPTSTEVSENPINEFQTNLVPVLSPSRFWQLLRKK
jgi:hypothetical protein